MRRLESLSKVNSDKFIDGFNLYVLWDYTSSYGYSHSGAECARTIILHRQLSGTIDAHKSLRPITAGELDAVEILWNEAADFFGYGPKSGSTASIIQF